ncbi:MAG: hypothetical protein EA381_18170 [Planctomycetaceae bacterium]|nr:MAG: hypothetical protein EA381_18170 [Planctomycetaceae bacterium]
MLPPRSCDFLAKQGGHHRPTSSPLLFNSQNLTRTEREGFWTEISSFQTGRFRPIAVQARTSLERA